MRQLYILYLFSLLFFHCGITVANDKKTLVGTYYFDGWSGQQSSNEQILANGVAPSHLTKKLSTQFCSRQPIWGWRDDDISIMERQIDLAADNGIDFFMFCWYYGDDKGKLNTKTIETSSLNTSIQLFMRAKNKHKMKFAVLIANHEGHEIDGKEQWIATIQYLSNKYFTDSQYLKIDNCPVVEFYVPEQPHKYIKEIRATTKKKGYKDLCFFSCGKFYPDADINGWYNIIPNNTGKANKQKYKELTSYTEECWYWEHNNYNVIPIVMAGWDKRPWEDTESSAYYIKRSPKLFGRHFQKAIECINASSPKIPIIMIYAWNEIGEGGYLIPTKEDKNAKFLKQIRKARKKHRI